MRVPPVLRQVRTELGRDAVSAILANAWNLYVRPGDQVHLSDAPAHHSAAVVATRAYVARGWPVARVEMSAGTVRLEVRLEGLAHRCDHYITRAAEEAATKALQRARRKDDRQKRPQNRR